MTDKAEAKSVGVNREGAAFAANQRQEPKLPQSGVLCACRTFSVIKTPPVGFGHLTGKCFRCLCVLRAA